MLRPLTCVCHIVHHAAGGSGCKGLRDEVAGGLRVLGRNPRGGLQAGCRQAAALRSSSRVSAESTARCMLSGSGATLCAADAAVAHKPSMPSRQHMQLGVELQCLHASLSEPARACCTIAVVMLSLLTCAHAVDTAWTWAPDATVKALVVASARAADAPDPDAAACADASVLAKAWGFCVASVTTREGSAVMALTADGLAGTSEPLPVAGEGLGEAVSLAAAAGEVPGLAVSLAASRVAAGLGLGEEVSLAAAGEGLAVSLAASRVASGLGLGEAVSMAAAGEGEGEAAVTVAMSAADGEGDGLVAVVSAAGEGEGEAAAVVSADGEGDGLVAVKSAAGEGEGEAVAVVAPAGEGDGLMAAARMSSVAGEGDGEAVSVRAAGDGEGEAVSAPAHRPQAAQPSEKLAAGGVCVKTRIGLTQMCV